MMEEPEEEEEEEKIPLDEVCEEETITLSLDSVRDFLLANNGRVKQDQLINHFRDNLCNPTTKVYARQELKDILQLITAIKVEDDVKYIVLTKQNKENFKKSLITRKSKRFRTVHHQEMQKRDESGNLKPSPAPSRKCGSPAVTPKTKRKSTSSAHALMLRHHVTSSVENICQSSSHDVISTSMDSINTVDSNAHACSDDEIEDEVGLNVPETMGATDKHWFIAASCGNIYKLKRLYNDFPDVLQCRDFIYGYTALHWAAKLGKLDIVNFVVSHGIDVNCKSHGGFTALHIAAMSGKDDVIVRLINVGANIHSRDHGGRKPKDVVLDKVADEVQRMLGRNLVIKPNTVLQTNVLSLQSAQRNKNERNSTFYKPKSRENSPDTIQKGLSQVNRSMSFFKNRVQSPLAGKKPTHPGSNEVRSRTNEVKSRAKSNRERKAISMPFDESKFATSYTTTL